MIAAVVLCLALPLSALAEGDAVPTDWSFVQKKLSHAGFKKSFISAMRKNYDPNDFNSVVELNSLLFLRKTDYHTPQVSNKAVDDVRQFMAEHDGTLMAAEKKFGVSKGVISGLMWMESRYGENQGRFHVASVFLDLVQAERPQVIAHLKLEAAPRFAPHLTKKIASDITAKAQKKAKWAMGELKALQTMYFKDKKLVLGLKGSFAGAFGMPQFEPSSYVAYARSSRGKKKSADLTTADDAIYSVANYLKESGFKKTKEKTHEKALMKYNNSHDYARAILKLAKQADTDSRRLPASKSKKKKRRTKKA
jgi:membrane-bound lytic murein transglycosylase B